MGLFKMGIIDNLDATIVITAAIHLFCCPFTKVEESFNLHATHDILYHGLNISAYDHNEFPGVVPRTFLGPLFICFLSTPFYFLIRCLNLNKFAVQYAVRGVLGLTVLFGFRKLRCTVRRLFGTNVSVWFTIITMSQYHFMYYLSRTLPNTMTLPFVLIAYHAWLRRRYELFIWCSAISVIIFRFELAMLFGLIVLFELYYKRISFLKIIKLSIPPLIVCVLLTVTVDSFFWRRLVWPEAEVFWFNTVLNKSSEWGTSPFLWYFYSAIPRGLGCSVFLLPVSAVYDIRISRLLLPSVIFVILFSFLPHKELRFIIYVFPLFNIAVANLCSRIWRECEKHDRKFIMARIVATHLLVNLLFTCFLLAVSSTNYPGGQAIFLLQKTEKSTVNVSVHFDEYTAQTGATKFTELYSNWRYNKTENLTVAGVDMLSFDYLLVEAKSRHSSNLKPYIKTHEIVEYVVGFSHVVFNYNKVPPVQVKVKPQIFILKRLAFTDEHFSNSKIETLMPSTSPKILIREKTDECSNNYIAAVTEYRPVRLDGINETFIRNAVHFERMIEKASQHNADIIVFPEGGLSNFPLPDERAALRDYLTEIPSADKHVIPYLNHKYYNGVLYRLSYAAKKYNMYIVFNLPEIKYCSRGDFECQADGEYFYNTNVVIDRNGEIIARCRKVNLFCKDSFDYPNDDIRSCTFGTDFGVTFGMFICFDILFRHPSVNVVRDMNITDIIYLTAWYSELPFLTSVQIQSAWSYAMDVNFLASDYNRPEESNGGSGIYSGTSGSLIAYMPQTSGSKLLLSSVSKKRNKCVNDRRSRQNEDVKGRNDYNAELKPLILNLNIDTGGNSSEPILGSTNVSSMLYWNDPSFKNFTVQTIDPTKTLNIFRYNSVGFNCTINVTYEDKRKNTDKMNYKVFGYSGIRSFTCTLNTINVCGLAACLNSVSENMCISPPVTLQDETKILSVEINVSSSNKSSLIVPITLQSDFYPLHSGVFTYSSSNSSENASKVYTAELMLVRPVVNLLTFALYQLPLEPTSYRNKN